MSDNAEIIDEYILLNNDNGLRSDDHYNQAVNANNTGVNHTRCGNFEKAISSFDSAINYFITCKEHRSHLSDAYYNRYLAKKDSLLIDLIASLGFKVEFSDTPIEFAKKFNALRNLLKTGYRDRS